LEDYPTVVPAGKNIGLTRNIQPPHKIRVIRTQFSGLSMPDEFRWKRIFPIGE
jgi:hypothetical protein